MKLDECEKLNRKYHELITMVQESLEITLHEYKEKSKRNKFFLEYKKRVYEEINKLKHQIQTKDKIIEDYKEQVLSLKKENFILKNKFKHLSDIFKSNKETELLNKYFPEKIEFEYKLVNLIRQVIKEKINTADVSVLYFRKYFKKLFNQYLIKYIKEIVGSEKLAIVIAQIVKKEYKDLINKIVAKTLLDRINTKKEYEEFIEILLKKDLVEKDKVYKHLNLDYSIDNIKRIIRNYQLLNKEEKIENISFDIELKEIQNKKEELKNKKEVLAITLYELQKEEDKILSDIVSNESSKEENKQRLDEIDEEKRNIKEQISLIEKEFKKLENREMFIKPLIEVETNKVNNEYEERYIEEYNKLIDDFVVALKDI